MKHNKKKCDDYVVTWHEITLETYDSLLPLVNSVQPIFIDAFLPLTKKFVFMCDPRLVNLSEEKKSSIEKKIVDEIVKSLKAGWQERIPQIKKELQDKIIHKAYLAIARDSSQHILGFSLSKEEHIKNYLAKRLLKTIEGSIEHVTANPDVSDQLHVSLLAVLPQAQKKGIGTVLLFIVFDYCPLIKKLYLTTSAHESNKEIQAFYERLGFGCVVRGIFKTAESSNFEHREKMVYSYQK